MRLKTVKLEEIKILYDLNYYDGMIEGIILYQDNPYYVTFTDETKKSHRIFYAYPLEEIEYIKICLNIEVFRNYFGDNHCYHEDEPYFPKQTTDEKITVLGWYANVYKPASYLQDTNYQEIQKRKPAFKFID